MKIFKKQEQKISWLQVITAFTLGILIAANLFLIFNFFNLQREINKLKADDIALAQAINSLLAQAEAVKNSK
ncbi:MAG: hypothetical protein NTZ49_03405 [Candidatus Parcubacteria bacterium]|nr:hypothetical protein [Candidatus Parcubacteria bacterium]